jgi:copper chaperone CopZ
MQPIRLKIEGMGATGVIEAVENALRTVPGVLRVRFDPVPGNELHVDVADTVDPELLIEAVQNAGYIATLSG